MLERTQKDEKNITTWLVWFLGCMDRAIERSERLLVATLTKARYWQHIAHHPLNPRQHAMVNRLLDGFEGNLTTSKRARITKCSTDAALRNITDPMDRGVLVRNPARGRSTNDALADLS